MSLKLGRTDIAGLATNKVCNTNNLLEARWFDHILDSVEWLRADTFSWQSGDIYTSAYNLLLSEYDEATDYEDFVIPKLTSNGTLGGNTFACSASNNYDTSLYPLYKTFTGEGIWYCSTAPVDVTFYNPIKLNVTNIQCQNRTDAANYTFTAGTVYGSNDNSNWSTLTTFTNSNTGAGATYNIDLSSNTNFYNYYKITFSTASTTGVGAYINITAKTEVRRTQRKFKIAPASCMNAINTIYENTGIAWYYILDKENKQFKLPRTKFGFEGVRTNVGDNVEAGLPNIAGYTRGARGDSDIAKTAPFYSYSSLQGMVTSSSVGGTSLGFDLSLSNSIYGNSNTVQEPATQMYLYFFVGNFTRTAVEQTAGINSEQLNNKVDISDCAEVYPVIQTYQSGASWYRIYSDGWCEMGGVITSGVNVTTYNIVFLKTFADTNYNLQLTYHYRSATANISYKERDIASKTTTGATVRSYTNYVDGIEWRACGQLAEGQY